MSISSNNEKSNQNEPQPAELEETAKRKCKLDKAQLAKKLLRASILSSESGSAVAALGSRWIFLNILKHMRKPAGSGKHIPAMSINSALSALGTMRRKSQRICGDALPL